MKTEPKPIESWQLEDAGRLKAIFDRREPKISQADFGVQYELGTQGMVSQYLLGRRPLNIKAAGAFARGLGVTVETFSPTIAEQINAASRAVTPIDFKKLNNRRLNLAALMRAFCNGEPTILAEKIGTTAVNTEKMLFEDGVRGQKQISDDMAERIENAFGLPRGEMDLPEERTTWTFTPSNVVIAEEGDADFYTIPKVQLQLSAGMTGFQTVPEIYDGSKLSVSKNWVERNGYIPERLVAIRVKGDSMEPNLYEDDQVIINTGDTRMEDGAVFAVNFEGQAVVKRLIRDRGEWWLASDNPDQVRHRRKSCRDGECIIIGRIVRRETDRI